MATAQFIPPVRHSIALAGNVGEIRATHFHAGIDIKATQGIGSDIVATAGGYISRIGVSPTGYGNVIYVTHPSGHVSVYAHLDGFAPAIQKWVVAQQYAKRSFAVNLYPPRAMFPISQGQTIGYMGNSGSSSGPHLHFELRDPQNRPQNIAHHRLFSLPVDTIPPTLFKVVVYQADTTYGVVHYHPTDTLDFTAPGPQKALRASRDFYLAYELIDHKNGVQNTFGVYSLEQRVDTVVNFSFTLPHTDYAYSKYVRTLAQYEMNRGQRHHCLRAYVSQHNWLPIYSGVQNRGIISPPQPHAPKIITTTLIDDCGNATIHSFVVSADTTTFTPPEPNGYAVWTNIPFAYDFGHWRVEMARESTYDNHILPFYADSTQTRYTIGDERYALHLPITVTLRLDSIPKHLRNKALLYSKTQGATAQIKEKNGSHKASINTMGEYELLLDTLPPTIKLLGVQAGGLNFTIKDNLSGIHRYTMEVDDKWALGEWDPKRQRLTHKIKRNQTPINHKITVTITDYVGNRTVKKYNVKW